MSWQVDQCCTLFHTLLTFAYFHSSSFLFSHPFTTLPLFFQVLWKVDTILFSLLVLQGLSDSQGRVWRCHPTQLYAIEVTLPEQSEQQVC